MSYSLNLLPTGAPDFLPLGALVHRLDPGVIPWRKAVRCPIHARRGSARIQR